MAKWKSARAAFPAASAAAPNANSQITSSATRQTTNQPPQTTHQVAPQTTSQPEHPRSQTQRPVSSAAPRRFQPPRPASAMRFLPLGLLALLVLTVAVVMAVFFGSPGPGVAHYPASGQQQAACQPGQARPCTVGNCSGTSACLGDGSWGGCTWAHSCEAGSRIPCLRDGCSYAYRECNPCGSGYGQCVPFSS